MRVKKFTIKYLVLQPQQKRQNDQKLEHVPRSEILFLDLDFLLFLPRIKYKVFCSKILYTGSSIFDFFKFKILIF
jgi:hypothetical protein